MVHKRAIEVAEAIVGTCKSLSDFATTDEENDLEFCNALDDEVFQCADCGWWSEISEVSENENNGEQVCTDCSPNEED